MGAPPSGYLSEVDGAFSEHPLSIILRAPEIPKYSALFLQWLQARREWMVTQGYGHHSSLVPHFWLRSSTNGLESGGRCSTFCALVTREQIRPAGSAYSTLGSSICTLII